MKPKTKVSNTLVKGNCADLENTFHKILHQYHISSDPGVFFGRSFATLHPFALLISVKQPGIVELKVPSVIFYKLRL